MVVAGLMFAGFYGKEQVGVVSCKTRERQMLICAWCPVVSVVRVLSVVSVVVSRPGLPPSDLPGERK